MSDLTYDTFQKNQEDDARRHSGPNIDAREVIKRHNQNASSFYKQPIHDNLSKDKIDDDGENGLTSLYRDLVNQLSSLLERNNNDSPMRGEDLSTIQGDMMSQIYYYGITAILLYVFYRMLYKKRK
jgi:hypothetical protein